MQRVPSGAPCLAGLKTRNCVFDDIRIFMAQYQENF